MFRLEQASRNPAAAEQAKGQARQLYLAYRRDGGESRSGGARLCAAFYEALQGGQTDEMRALLPQLAANPERGESFRALATALQTILNGNRDPALAADPALNYQDAAEVALLLEKLG